MPVLCLVTALKEAHRLAHCLSLLCLFPRPSLGTYWTTGCGGPSLASSSFALSTSTAALAFPGPASDDHPSEPE